MLLHLVTLIQALHDDCRGLAMVEYAVAGGLVTLTVVAAFVALGGGIEAGIERLVSIVVG